jgi:hypothetical protein
VPDTEDESHRPAQFAAALDAIRHARPRAELVVTEIAAPGNLAPYAVALSADVTPVRHGNDSDFGTGRFILLYDPDEPDSWGGPFRVVCFAQAPLETDIGVDPFLAEVAWAWLIDALDTRGAEYTAASGTATKILSSGFGELAHQGDGAQIELRASWSPLNNDLAAHVEGWGELLCMLAGLPPAGEPPARGPHPAGTDTAGHHTSPDEGIALGPLERIGPSSTKGRRSGPGLHTLGVVATGLDTGGKETAGDDVAGPDRRGASSAGRETVGMHARAQDTDRPVAVEPGRADDRSAENRSTGQGSTGQRSTRNASASTSGSSSPADSPPGRHGDSGLFGSRSATTSGVADLSARRAARG